MSLASRQFKPSTVIAVLMICAFSIGTTEYVVTGVLTHIAQDLGVTIAAAGLVVSMYALGVAVFGPLMTTFSVKLPRKPMLLLFMLIFIISNIISATAPNFTVLLVSRVTSAFIHGPFFALAFVMASELVEPRKRVQAIAAVNGGLTIAIMIGVPFGAYLGSLIEWRLVFWLIAFLGVIGMIGLLICAPNTKPAETPLIKQELSVFKHKQVLLTIAIIIFGYSGVFTAYTYIEPLLRSITGFGGIGIMISLFFFGMGSVIGNFSTPKLAGGNVTKTLIYVFAILTVILLLFPLATPYAITAVLVIGLFGAGAFGTTPLLQSKIVMAAKEGPTIAAAASVSAFNLANASGAYIGGIVLDANLGYTWLSVIGAGISIIGILLSAVSYREEKKAAEVA
ncbi:Predicted arabinose efflux permease, MFS family [Terribacillus halophilus]|uniref:Predicted arabinose efflux permease, MFS family n=1 Tax=Terribacillus halophilus TaxID=361279 RepID=A0A1G6JEH6_9BACI|nr:MFS transporter [Terribacillus halophilus]SDC17111.1 Predicted arabinose efflux permease, MFS family [Terribacillus halophilus]